MPSRLHPQVECLQWVWLEDSAGYWSSRKRKNTTNQLSFKKTCVIDTQPNFAQNEADTWKAPWDY